MFTLSCVFAIQKELPEPHQSECIGINQQDDVIVSSFEAVNFSTQLEIVKHESLFGSNCLFVKQSEAIYINKLSIAYKNTVDKYDYGAKNIRSNKLASNIEKVKYGMSSGGLPYLYSQVVTI
jgi:hypothetical protein